jgi:hypothetical protein
MLAEKLWSKVKALVTRADTVDAQLAAIPTNIKTYGAVGNGITDDTAAILEAVATGKNLVATRGTYVINSTFQLGENQSFEMEKGALLLVKSDVDVVKMKPGSRLSGAIEIGLPTWNKTVVTFDGVWQFNQQLLGGLFNLTVRGDWQQLKGVGVALNATDDNYYVMMQHFTNVNIMYFEYGIKINVDKIKTTCFVNANIFNNVSLWHCKHGIYNNGGNGNQFVNIQYQSHPSTVNALYCSGEYNQFNLQYWDVEVITGDKTKAIFFTDTSKNNIMISNYADYGPGYVTDEGRANVIIGKTDENYNAIAANNIANAVVPNYPWIFGDTFNRADATNGLGTATSGQAWAKLQGNDLGILNGQAYLPTAGSSKYVVDIGVPDFYAEYTVPSVIPGAGTNMLFRTVNEWFYWRIAQSGASLSIQKINDGPANDYPTNAIIKAGDKIGVECIGDTITAYVNGKKYLTLTDAFNNSATKIGITLNHLTVRMDNLVARAIV